MCNSMLSIFLINAHFFSVNRMAPNRSVNRSLIFCDYTMGNCIIYTGYRMLLELFCNVIVGKVILAGNQYPCCVHINPMDDSRTKDAVNSR